MNTKTLITSIQKITQVFRPDTRFNPSRDWLVALSCFFVLFVASIIWNTMYFFTVLSTTTQETVSTADMTNSDSTVKQVEKVFVERERSFEAFKAQNVFVDPSR